MLAFTATLHQILNTYSHKLLHCLFTLLAVCGLAACASLPPAEPVTEPIMQVTETNSQLAQVVHALQGNRDELTGIYPLNDSHDSFAARVSLIHSAEHTLDLQYYIWHNDTSGKILANALIKAAQRGVKVRLLLDDNNTNGLDELLLRLDRQANIQVRLFNPFVNRKFRFLGYVTDFDRLNHRMHNKAFIVDQQAAILGGRNIGDEYFGASDGVLFMDLDVLTVGKVVKDIQADFERYWRSEASYALHQIVKPKASANSTQLEQAAQAATDTSKNERAKKKAYLEKIANSDYATALKQQRLPLIWSHTTLVTDDPAKAIKGSQTPKHDLLEDLSHALGEPKNSFMIVSPYFVPTKTGTNELVHLANSGVNITILTNSLAATDVAIVHSGYSKYRKPLLKAGIHLYEFKPNIHNPLGFKDRGLTGNSGSSLHAKTIAVDNNALFIGSFNMDPRSANVNTENGVVIHNPELTRYVKQTLLNNLPNYAYQVRLNENEQIEWVDHGDDDADTQTIYHREPKAGFFKRSLTKFLSWFPLDALL